MVQVLKTQMQSSSGNVTMKEADSLERRILENSQNCVRCADSKKDPNIFSVHQKQSSDLRCMLLYNQLPRSGPITNLGNQVGLQEICMLQAFLLI